jgi:hypothetical protein
MTQDPADVLSFATNIRPLFRPKDQESMESVFDLWDYNDVSDNADAILDALRSGKMPCDGAWPADQVQMFGRWIEDGKPA